MFVESKSKVKRAWERYILVTFCYGCNLGPVQTARSIRGIDRFKLAFINQGHITEANLNDAITTVINAYVHLPLQRLWGKGKSASADGMKWDLYPQSLMSEYHIRYGGYGGIGYYMVSDSYIALMSRFTTCGSWEGHFISSYVAMKRLIVLLHLARRASYSVLAASIWGPTRALGRFMRPIPADRDL